MREETAWPRPVMAVGIAGALLAGLAIGAWVTGDRSADEATGLATSETPDTDVPARLASLEQMLFEEREARIALEDTLALLSEEIDALSAAENRDAPRREARQAAVDQEARRRERSDWMRDINRRRIDQMVAGGLTEEEARLFIEQESAASYEAMRAAWEAERNGETVDPLSAMSDPQRILRESIGDAAYERYLTAQGEQPSVTIMQVLSGSPGESVGLEPGDSISSYNGERVFSIRDLRDLAMQGDPGEDAVIEVVRDGVTMQLTVPAGPIGVTGTGARVRGMMWWGG